MDKNGIKARNGGGGGVCVWEAGVKAHIFSSRKKGCVHFVSSCVVSSVHLYLFACVCVCVGVAALSYKLGPDGMETALGREDDVYELARQYGKEVILIFRPSGAAQVDPVLLNAVARAGDADVLSPRARPTLSNRPLPPHNPAATLADVPESDALLAQRVAEQERMILALRSKVSNLEMIEKEQQRIIDSQDRASTPTAARRGNVGGTGFDGDMEKERLRMALQEERQQHEYDLMELARLKREKEDLMRKAKKTGLLGDEFHRMDDDNPETTGGCNTQCVIQ